jgi:Zn-dependent peptidase ImmA (M78 family)
MEDHAFEFACNLLIPETELRNAFEGQSAVRLVQAKEKFGISMAAMIYRAEKLKIISEKTAKRLWIQFAKRGWRSNEPGSVRPDRAIRFETILDKGLALRKIKLSEAVSIMGVTRNQLEERMRLAMGCTRHNDEAAWKGEATLRLHDDERSA